MFVFGGSTGSAKDDFYELDIRRSLWAPVRHPRPSMKSGLSSTINSISSPNSNRMSTSAMSMSGHDLFDRSDGHRGDSDGFDDEGFGGEDLFLDGGQLQPGSRFCHVACVYDHAMYIFGGKITNNLFVFI